MSGLLSTGLLTARSRGDGAGRALATACSRSGLAVAAPARAPEQAGGDPW
jgi:hypothetical protein